MDSTPKTQFVYFGTYTGAKSKGIYVSEFDPKLGTLSVPRLVAESKNPTFLALNEKTKTLYAANEVGDFGGTNSGAVSAFRFDSGTGALSLMNEQASGGSGPCHLSLARDGSCVLVANYGSGSVAVLSVEEDGRLRPVTNAVQHKGSSKNPQRQEGPHAHFITESPTGGHVLACDLGLDKVLVYNLDGGAGLTANEPPYIRIKAGSGPRHLAFGSGGRFVYILNELSSTITVCGYDTKKGELNELTTVSTLPESFRGMSTAAEIQLDASGRTLYASNRGDDSIAVFRVGGRTGLPKHVQTVSTMGRTPRHFALDPTGQWLIAENQDSDKVIVFGIEAGTGCLKATGVSQAVGAPVCAVFASKTD